MAIKSIRIRGPYRGISGYDHHVRAFTREILRRGIDVQLVDLPAWGPARPPEEWDPALVALDRPLDAQISLQFCMPHQVDFSETIPIVNHTMYEADRVPTQWVEAGRSVTMTLLPTESSRQAWIYTGADPDRLRLSPLGVNCDWFAQRTEAAPVVLANGRRLDSYRHRFLNVSAWDHRKNFLGLYRAWYAATKPDDDAVLVIKLGCFHDDTWTKHAEPYFKQILQFAARGGNEAAPIHIIRESLTDEEMRSLFAMATHYFSMSHGEGWDLPMMEAIASDCTPIAPDHSAYQTYLFPNTAHLIPSKPAIFAPSVGHWQSRVPQYANWWNPDETDAASLLRAVINGEEPSLANNKDWICEEFSWERSTDRLLELLEEALIPVPKVAQKRSFLGAFRRKRGV